MSTLAPEKMLPLFPALHELEGPACPICEKTPLYEHSEGDLFSCWRCKTWYKLEGGMLVPTPWPVADTAALALPWRPPGRGRGAR